MCNALARGSDRFYNDLSAEERATVRTASLMIIPYCIALLGDDAYDEAKDWLNYWVIGIAHLIDAANRLKPFTEILRNQRPFLQNTGNFPLFCKAPNTRRAAFGDDSTQGDLPGIKTGLNMRQFTGATRKGAVQWYCEENLRLNPGTEGAFYNWGWWDTNFDELVFQTDFPVVEATAPEGGLRHVKGIGWSAFSALWTIQMSTSNSFSNPRNSAR